jgi:hypothetical protein
VPILILVTPSPDGSLTEQGRRAWRFLDDVVERE